MSLLLPDLHDRLVAAAGHPPRRAPQLLRQAAPLVAAALAIAVVLVFTSEEGGRPAGSFGVPEATLAKADALTRAPTNAPPTGLLSPQRMRVYVADLVDELPYPPNAIDDLQAYVRPFSSGADMGSIDSASDARLLGEYRAQCTWQLFWLRSTGQDRAAATRVLQTVAQWPTFRNSQIAGRARTIAQAAAAEDVAEIAAESRRNCGATPLTR